MKTIGVLGGLGPQATIDFEDRLHRAAQRAAGPGALPNYPPMIVSYFREPPIVLNPDKSVPADLTPNPAMVAAVAALGTLADFIVIPSNTVHFFTRELEAAAKRPILSMIDVTLDAVAARRPAKVGVLAVSVTLEHRLFQNRLDQAGLPWESIPIELSERLDKAIFGYMSGAMPDDAENPAIEAVRLLREAHCDPIILGCTEIPLLLEGRLEADDLVNPAELLAEAALARAVAG